MAAPSPDIASLEALLCCPHCHAAVRLGPEPSCGCCGAACAWDGPVLNFLGEKTYVLPDRRDAAVAGWLVRAGLQHPDLLAELRGRESGLEEPDSIGAQTLRGKDGPTAEEMKRLIAKTTFGQIVNDVERYLTGTAPPSATVEFLLKEANIQPGSRVLDVGCSCGRHLWETVSARPALLVGVDIQLFPLLVGALAWQLQRADDVPALCCADAVRLPFRDHAFTHVNSFVALSAVPLGDGLRELARVLAPGGRLTITMEGMGYWRRDWEACPRFAAGRLSLLRRWLGAKLFDVGLDWQRHKFMRRLCGHTQIAQGALCRFVERQGLVILQCRALQEYRGKPLLLGLTAEKPT